MKVIHLIYNTKVQLFLNMDLRVAWIYECVSNTT